MEEEIGKFFCPKCNEQAKISFGNRLLDVRLFRTRTKNGIKKWIFKSGWTWCGDLYCRYNNMKDCWEETGGFSEKELNTIIGNKNSFKCERCKYITKDLKTLFFQVEFINSEENNSLKLLEQEIQEEKIKSQILEKEIQEEKNKNIILNETINSIMSELKEIKAALFEIKDKTNTSK